VGPTPAASVGMVLTGIVSVQVGGAFAATLFDRVGPAGAVVLRLVFAAAVMLAWVRPRPRTWSRDDPRVVLGFGVALGVMNLTFYEALDRLPLGAAVTLEVLGPLTVAVATGRRWRDGLWAVLAFTGVLVLGGGNLGLDPVGVAFALAAGVCWGAYILASAASGRRFAGQQGLVGAMVVAAVLVCPFGIPQLAAGSLDASVLLAGLGIALASSVIPYSLELAALRRLPPAVFGVLMSLEPAVAALAGLVVLGQRLTALGVLAIALVVAASAGASLTGRTTTPVAPD
jgi:inner membrane transporter RhtA